MFKFLSTKKNGGFGGKDGTALIPRKKLIAIITDKIKKYEHDEKNVGTILLKIFSLKQIRNTHGFQKSDQFIADTITNISSILKDTDSVHRINEDELVIILPGLINDGHLVLAANRIKTVFDAPINIGNTLLSIKVAMGAALYPKLANDAEDLLMKSSIALEEGIDKGMVYNVYPREEATALKSHPNIETQLRDAIEDNALEVHYQPKVNIKSGTIVGVEALARWNHPLHGLLPPNYLLDIAQKANLTNEFTNSVLNITLKEARGWRGIGADIDVSVNLSITNLFDDTLIEKIQRAINLWDIAPGKVIFELAESAMMENPMISQLVMNNIKSIGSRCSIDAFGIRFSALAYLKKLPISELKIDASYVSNLLLDEGDKLLIDSIIKLAQKFNLQVVAEGVDNEGTYKLLEQINCNIAQGPYIAKPMPDTQFKQWLKDTTWTIKAI